LTRKLKPSHKPPVPKRQPPKWKREKNLSLLIWILISTTILAVVTLVGYWAYDNYIGVWNKRVSTVNETTFDMRDFVRMLRFASRSTGETVNATTFPYGVLTQMEDAELVRQKTSELGIAMPSGNVTQAVEDGPFFSGMGNMTEAERDAEYQRRLDFVGLTNAQLRQVVEADLLVQELYEYFRENEVPAEAKHVLLYALNRDSEEEAVAALDQIASGNATVEQELLAGTLGWVPEGIYTEFDTFAFSLTAGNTSQPLPSTSQPISTSQGYSLVRVTGIEENRTVSDQHRDILANSTFEAWRTDARLSGVVRYVNDDDVRWAVDHID
jgi:hypothetical protein